MRMYFNFIQIIWMLSNYENYCKRKYVFPLILLLFDFSWVIAEVALSHKLCVVLSVVCSVARLDRQSWRFCENAAELPMRLTAQLNEIDVQRRQWSGWIKPQHIWHRYYQQWDMSCIPNHIELTNISISPLPTKLVTGN